MPKSRSHLTIATALVLAGAMAVSLWVATHKDRDPAPAAVVTRTVAATGDTPPASTDQPTSPVRQPGTPIIGLKVAANSGGKKLGPDKFTRMGFPKTCEGAVGAAASFRQFSNAPTSQGAREATAALIAPGTGRGLEQFRAFGKDEAQAGLTAPAQGGFRVTTCIEGQSAQVELWTCERTPTAAGSSSWCYSGLMDMRWAPGDMDWRVAAYEGRGAGPSTAWPRDKDMPFPLPPAERKRLLKAAGTGWTEFTDAAN